MIMIVVMVVMVIMIVVMATAAAVPMVMVVMMMTFLKSLQSLFHQFLFHGIRLFNDLQQLSTGKLCYRCGNNYSLRICFPKQLDCRIHFLLIRYIRTAENDGSCIGHLIVEKFTEVFHIHLAFGSVYYRNCTVQSHIQVGCHILYCFHHIRELPHS